MGRGWKRGLEECGRGGWRSGKNVWVQEEEDEGLRSGRGDVWVKEESGGENEGMWR